MEEACLVQRVYYGLIERLVQPARHNPDGEHVDDAKGQHQPEVGSMPAQEQDAGREEA